MASPTAPIISATGIFAPTYAVIYAYLQAQYLAIFGADALITPDTQDGQLLAVFAQAISDANSACVAVYNSFSPATAQGAGLSSNVQINGLSRLVPSSSTASAVVLGVPNVTIVNGQCIDPSGNIWTLPASVTIGLSGTVATTVTCLVAGATPLGANTLAINTPTYGWTGVTNSVATPGAPAETDAALRVRQNASVSLPSLTIFEGIVASIEQVTAVTRVRGIENNTSANLVLQGGTIPPNNLDFIVEGGTSAAIFNAIFEKITPGIPTWNAGGVNNVSQVVTDTNGSTRLLNYQVPTDATISVNITLHALNGWNVTTESIIAAALVTYFYQLPIGANISYFGLINVIALLGTQYAGTFEVTALQIQKNALAAVTADIQLNYNEAAISTVGVITFAII
jgi:hypothetical protein